MLSNFVNLRHTYSTRLWLGPLLLWLLLITGCNERIIPTPTPPQQPTAVPSTQPIDNATAIPTTNDQLVVWLPAFTGVASVGSAGATLTSAFNQFEQNNPGVRLDIQVKADSGTASLFNFIRSAHQVAPTILPDLVLIDTQQLWQLVDLGVVTALSEEELLSEVDFFPPARAAVRYRSQNVGIPYAVEIIHLAYDGNEIASPPENWAALLDGDHPLIFPAAENGTSNATLLHYVGAGGELLEDGNISDPVLLEQFFTGIAQAREQGVIPTSVLDMQDFNTVWRAYTEDRSQLAMVKVAQFYPNIAGITPSNYAAVPTQSGTAITIANSWAFAVITHDAQRRQLALALIRELLEPEIQGAWSQAIARLPSQPGALALWTQTNGYSNFAQGLLTDAVALPNGAAFADFARRLHSAQAGIIRGDLSVEAAVESMLALE